mmetsp:Transcript_18389/g.43138  ORF Transcript_18389/g.43138 Transcript_18389/m.43138 type:complete len:108 (+) Transcript_18389:241-564(+)
MAAKEKKEKVENPASYGRVRIAFKDVDAEAEAAMMAATGQALKDFHKGDTKHFWQIAEGIKNQMAEWRPGKWHVFVGKEFGSFVTHESGTLLYFFVGQTGILIFKHG